MAPLVVLIDVDGTLVGRNDYISELTIQAIQKLKSYTENIILCTGRQYERCLELQQSMDLYDYVVAADGSDIRTPDGTRIRHEILSIEDLLFAYQVSRENDVTLIYSADEGNFISKFDDNIPFFLSYKDKMPQIISTTIGEFFKRKKIRMIYVLDRNNSTELSQFVSRLKNEGLDIRRSVPGYASVVKRGVSKASAYKFLCNRGLLAEHHKCIVIGDGENDIPLFEIADFSFCMDSANIETKLMASQIVASVEQDGAVQAIDWILNKAKYL